MVLLSKLYFYLAVLSFVEIWIDNFETIIYLFFKIKLLYFYLNAYCESSDED